LIFAVAFLPRPLGALNAQQANYNHNAQLVTLNAQPLLAFTATAELSGLVFVAHPLL
jgi:hypothetical protein